MTPPERDQLLAHAAQRAKAHPHYLGWVLARYMEREHISEAALAQHLGIAAEVLPQLALCLRPRREHFAADIKQISTKFNITPAALASVVRMVEVLEALGAENPAPTVDSGLLIAARARKPKRPPPDSEPPSHDQPEP